MSAEVLFATPPIPYIDFGTALDEQDTALAAAQFGGIERTAILRAKEAIVDDMIRIYKGFVTGMSNGDTEIILSSGFRHTKTRESTGAMPKVLSVKRVNTGVAGQLKLRWKTVAHSAFYDVRFRAVLKEADGTPPDPTDPAATTAADWTSISSKPATLIIPGLDSLTYYEVQVRAKGTAGYGPFSDVAVVLVT